MLTGRSFNSTLDRMLSLNEVLDEALASSWNAAASTRFWVPALDVVERPDAYLIALEVPGVEPADIDVSFEQNVLTVKGTKSVTFESAKEGQLRVHSAERMRGQFERSVRLPEFVDGDAIAAEYRNGVLHLTVPKVQAAQARRIEIKGVDRKQIAS